jgi:hypothetical protein
MKSISHYSSEKTVMRLFVFLFAICSSTLLVGEEIDFNRDIRPILSDNCFHCHGPDAATREADLRLDTRVGLLGDDGEQGVVVPRQPDASELLRRITSDDVDQRMPPPASKLTLTPAEIAKLQAWVVAGAAWQQHWAFETPQRPAIPAVKQLDWPQNEIDYFVLQQLEHNGLQPKQEAAKDKLLRRVTFDLTGLPPTIAELDAFLHDTSSDAYETAVNRLLQSPAYGERMVWDWLDAARYADTNGYQGDPTRTMWPWRDWAIEAFNQNMPYDQFTIEQLAGDLLDNATLEQRIATGFNRNHMHNGEGGRIADETRVENVFDRVETTATVWLGLTMTCSRCHDHKFDPIKQREYYQLFAYFNNSSENGGISGGSVPPLLELPTPEQRSVLEELSTRIPMLAEQIKTYETEQLLTKSTADQKQESEPSDIDKETKPAELTDETKALLAKAPVSRSSEELQRLIEQFTKPDTTYAQQLTELKTAIELRKSTQESILRMMVMDALDQPRETFVLERGMYNKPTEIKVVPDVPAVLPKLPADAPTNRLTLARWIVDRENPLTARVTVNRYWQSFFGIGLVKTAEDFGAQGERPSHPELLDWLAVEFMESGWDVKSLLKRIVMSAAYRQSAQTTAEDLEIDPENRLISRGPRFRLPAYMIRDAALANSGLLFEQLGGPPVKPYQPSGVWEEATFGNQTYSQDHGESLYRRSLYTFWRRIVGPTMFFDSSKRQVCSVKMTRTNTPLHALATLNDVTYVESARVLAQRLLAEDLTTAARIKKAFRLATSRLPHERELQVLTDRFENLCGVYQSDLDEARALIATGEFPADESLAPAEHAALTGICLMLLNLDEALTK